MTAYGEVGESSNRHQLIGDSYAGFGGVGDYPSTWEKVMPDKSQRVENIHFTQCGFTSPIARNSYKGEVRKNTTTKKSNVTKKIIWPHCGPFLLPQVIPSIVAWKHHLTHLTILQNHVMGSMSDNNFHWRYACY